MNRLFTMVAFVIIVSSLGCGKVSLPEKPFLILDRGSIGFGQEFGSCTRLGTAPQDTFKLENGGLADLKITGAPFFGDAEFTIDGPLKTTLKSKETTFVRVIFTPTVEKIYNGSITILSNASNAAAVDGGNPGTVLTVSGRGCVVVNDGG